MKVIIFLLLIMNSLIVSPLKARDNKIEKKNDSLRILDINVWSGLTYRGIFKMGEYDSPEFREKRYNALVTQIQQLNPDIIGIHEANKLPDYAKRLADTLGYDFFYHISLGGIRLGKLGLPCNLREGDGIVTKKYLNAEWVGRQQLFGEYVGKWAAFHFSDVSQVIAVKIICNSIPVYIFATHWHTSLSNSASIINKINEIFNLGEITKKEHESITLKIKEGITQRIKEAKKILEFIHKNVKDHPYILMGDFNADPTSSEINILLQNHLLDSYATLRPDSFGFTWDPNTNQNIKTYYLKNNNADNYLDNFSKIKNFPLTIPRRINYIFLGPVSYVKSQKIIVKSSRIVMKRTIKEVQASDHYRFLTEIQLKK